VFIVYRAVATVCTARFNIKRFYSLNGVYINVFCTDVREIICYAALTVWLSLRDGVFASPKELNILGINSGCRLYVCSSDRYFPQIC
jgi:hypothetical protein